MNDHSGSGKLIHDSFYPQSRFLMRQKKIKLLSFAWVILVLSLMIFTSTSHSSDGDDMVEASEAFTVVLERARNAAIADGSATGTIQDDDTPASISRSWRLYD